MKILIYLSFHITILGACAQNTINADIRFTPDLLHFENVSNFKERLQNVQIIGLGENTHGLGNVFKAKAELVKFLHEELGFNLVLFESGYGDAALAWELFDSLTPTEFTKSFTSNFYYHCEEIRDFLEYVKTRNGKLVIQGFDCLPQQDFLLRRMSDIVKPIDSLFSAIVTVEMKKFNQLYQFENNKDSLAFYERRDSFISFLNAYDQFLSNNQEVLLQNGATWKELNILKQSNQIIRRTYSTIELGSLMGWPIAEDLRDRSMFETVEWYRQQDSTTKIIIWAQNSHIENSPKPDYKVHWMGHLLKEKYGTKYYSIGTIVYSGTNLDYNGTFDFEHNDSDYLAYHLSQFKNDRYVFDLRKYDKSNFITKPLLDMENNGNTARSIAKDRFDGLLFLIQSGIPTLLEK